MTKLEELSVSGIKDFEAAVKRLEKIQEVKITIDLYEMKYLFSDQRKILKN